MDQHREPGDGSENWVEYRRLILSKLEDLASAQRHTDKKVDEIRQYISGQKAVIALVSLIFGTLGAALVGFFRKGAS